MLYIIIIICLYCESRGLDEQCSWMDSVLVGIIGEANGCKLLARADKETALYIFELAF